jgi:proteasome accessory factor A
MHLIWFDMALMPLANYLQAGTTQLVLALAEAGWADPALQLDDPLAAAWEVSRDVTLKKPVALAGRGRKESAVGIQRRLADLAGEFVDCGAADDCVPGAADIVDCWRQTLDWLQRRDLAALARRCDWALKYLILERQRARRGLSWDSPEIKCLDLRYASLDPAEGLFLQLAAAGQVEGMPTEEQITRFVEEPPEDTRAYLRAHALRRFGEDVADVDWDRIRFRTNTERYWSPGVWMGMPDPTAWGRAQADEVLARCQTAQELINAVGRLAERSKSFSDGWSREPWGPATGSYSYPRYYGW